MRMAMAEQRLLLLLALAPAVLGTVDRPQGVGFTNNKPDRLNEWHW